ncbi:MAG: TolC family protein [Lentisphaeria bacterium]|nr:TolC family protein [Lentisphaeria bacterium]
MNFKRFFIILPMVVLTGCATVREARKVQKGEDSPLGERATSAAELELTSDKAATLADLEQIALKANPSIRKAVNGVNMAYLAVKIQKADFLPMISASAGHSRTTRNTDKHNYDYDTVGTYNGALNLDLMIFDFGKTNAAVKQSLEEYKEAVHNLRSAENGVIYAVRTAYFALLRAVELDKVAKETVAQYKEHLDHVQIKNDVGSGTPFDLTKAKVDYNNAILKANSTANSVSICWTNLVSAIGLAESTSFSISTVKLHEYELDLDKLMNLARLSEPGLAALLTAEKAASLNVEKAIKDLYPSLNLNLGAVLSGHDPTLPMLWNATGAASLSGTLFTGGKKENAIKLAVLQLKNARASTIAYEQELYKKLSTATLNAELAQKQLQVAQLTESQAQEYFDIVSEQYNVGKASSLERTDAQVSLSDAKAKTVSAIYDYQDALALIANLIGDYPALEREEIQKPNFD